VSLPGSAVRLRQWMIAVAVLLALALPLAYSAIIVPLPPLEQAEASLAMIAFAIVASFSRTMRPLIIFMSCFASMRYFYWRISSTLNLATPLDTVVCLVLIAAETYGLVILFLGYFQTVELLERTPAPVKRTPTVDVFIPTYNESVDIVRRTLIGALAIEYPAWTFNRPLLRSFHFKGN
jgi:cellulose synthase (UDP-forming)